MLQMKPQALGLSQGCFAFPLRGTEGLHLTPLFPDKTSGSSSTTACRQQSCPHPAFPAAEQSSGRKQEKGSDLVLPLLLR